MGLDVPTTSRTRYPSLVPGKYIGPHCFNLGFRKSINEMRMGHNWALEVRDKFTEMAGSTLTFSQEMNTPLHLAARNGNIEVLQKIVETGVGLDEKNVVSGRLVSQRRNLETSASEEHFICIF